MDLQLRCCACNGTDTVKIWEAALWCAGCRTKEQNAQVELESTADDRVAEMNQSILDRQLAIDSTIKISADMFNAGTVSIVELEQAIINDESIENKNYELAKRVKDRIQNFQRAIFDVDKLRLEFTSAQRAAQEYMNNLSNKLREEEREELRLKDLKYVVKAPPKPRKPKAKKSAKFDKAHKDMLRTIAAALEIPEFTIQQICVSKNCNPIEAGEYLKGLMGKDGTNANNQE